MQENYDPHRQQVKLANIELDRANDMGYLIKYWKAIGTLPIPGVPHVEKLISWDEGLNID